jgi:hypothetical protein
VEPRLAFVEITPRSSERTAAWSDERIELEVGRIRLRVPERFSPETLRQVLDLLEARG